MKRNEPRLQLQLVRYYFPYLKDSVMGRPLWFVQLLRRAFPGRYILAKATRASLFGKLINRWLFEGDDLFYLPRNQTIQIHEPIKMSHDVVLPSLVVEHFIEQATVHWIMDTCICRHASQCEEYPIHLGCLFLGEAALDINPQLGRRVTTEEALDHIHRCQEAGLVHLIGRNKLDTVWLGVGPGERLLTICNCCPCCCLWRVLPYIDPKIGDQITRMPGVSVVVSDRCQGCGTCTQDICFVNAIQFVDLHAIIGEACRGCGRCVEVCPEGAIEINVEFDHYLENAIARLTPLVDVS